MNRKNRVMIIEDEAIIALGLKKNLTDLGYTVQSIVGSGKEALDLISIIEPDLVFVDVNLAGQYNGLETARIIHKIYDIPLIFCTGCDKTDVIKQTANYGNCGYLFKPYSEIELEKEIISVFDRYNRVSHRSKQGVS